MLFSCQVIFHVCFGSGPLAFYSTSEELSLCSASSVFSVLFLSPLLACVVTSSALSLSPGGKRGCDFWLACLDVVSEVSCFLTC